MHHTSFSLYGVIDIIFVNNFPKNGKNWRKFSIPLASFCLIFENLWNESYIGEHQTPKKTFFRNFGSSGRYSCRCIDRNGFDELSFRPTYADKFYLGKKISFQSNRQMFT
jgi:hypothetical protein